MFKLVCEYCGRESRIKKEDYGIDVEENFTIAVGDGEIDYVRCEGCKNTIFANKEIEKSVTDSD